MISPVRVGAGLGQGVQVFHGGVEYYDRGGKTVPHHPSEEEEQEKVVTGWLEGEGKGAWAELGKIHFILDLSKLVTRQKIGS